MSRMKVKTIHTLPETFSEGIPFVGLHEGEIIVGFVTTDGSEAFVFPAEALEALIAVYMEYVARQQDLMDEFQASGKAH